MSKNIVIFSDGIGQPGGERFDEVRANIYEAVLCPPSPRGLFHPGLMRQRRSAGNDIAGGGLLDRKCHIPTDVRLTLIIDVRHGDVADALGFDRAHRMKAAEICCSKSDRHEWRCPA
jgi:hypothetical protein